MPQSFASIPIHLIWSTRDRLPFIRSEIEKELFSYMAFIFREYESPALTINGTADHVHILSVFSRKITIAKLVEVVKKTHRNGLKPKERVIMNSIGRAVMPLWESDNQTSKR
jgi:REP element-mobilizing transposase RayT